MGRDRLSDARLDLETSFTHAITSERWISLGASAIGTSHLTKGIPNDDSFAIQTIPREDGSEWLVMVVCDGAGSAKFGGIGAKSTAINTIELIQNHTTTISSPNELQATIKEIVKRLKNQLVNEATSQSAKIRDFACTWVLAVWSMDELFIAQIGDGACVFHAADEWNVGIWPMQGEYANTTRFITDEHAEQIVETCTHLTAVDAIVLFSDGLQRLALRWQERDAMQGFFNPLYRSLSALNPPIHSETTHSDAALSWANQLAGWLNGTQVNSRTDDDKTMVWGVKRT